LNKVDINEGTTGANGVPAAICGFIGVLFLVFYPLIAVFFFLICAIMSMLTEGIEFDTETKQFRKYYDLFGLRSGQWKPLPKMDSLSLKLHVRSFKVKRWLPRSDRDSNFGTESVKTFNLNLVLGNEETVLYEFYKYNHGRKALEALGALMQIPFKDYFQEQIDSRGSRQTKD